MQYGMRQSFDNPREGKLQVAYQTFRASLIRRSGNWQTCDVWCTFILICLRRFLHCSRVFKTTSGIGDTDLSGIEQCSFVTF